MMKTKRTMFLASLPVLALGIMMVPGTACDGADSLCCSSEDFQAGGTISLEVGGNAQGQMAVQAIADVAGTANAMVEDITTACRNIAQDLEAPADAQQAAEKNPDKTEKAKAWCNLAVEELGKIDVKANLTISVDPPKCEASIAAKADCQAKCSVNGECDIKANPPKCDGGDLEVACKGECKAKVGVDLKCEGSCTGECTGSCTAQAGGVQCKGKCDGKCKASAESDESGFKADGTCEGICEGTCEVTAPGASCNGTCKGTCSAGCTGTADASVTCNGECQADYEPLKCTGGELSGGCEVDAKCDANCDASVSAKAECKPGGVKIDFKGEANAKLLKAKATLQANIGVIAAMKTKLQGVVNASGSIAANIEGFGEVKPACLIPIATAAKDAVADLKGSLELTVKLTGTVGI